MRKTYIVSFLPKFGHKLYNLSALNTIQFLVYVISYKLVVKSASQS